jgi:hypothetical protein
MALDVSILALSVSDLTQDVADVKAQQLNLGRGLQALANQVAGLKNAMER